MIYVLVTGGFDPLHSGHLAYFKEAKKLGDKLVVGVNSDAWLTRKKGAPFMPWAERVKIIENLTMVDRVIDVMNDDQFDDAGGAIFKLLSTTGGDDRIIVANGGDRVDGNVPEMDTYDHTERVSFVFGVGGTEKINSSSWILENYKHPKTQRDWGWYRVLDDKPGYKVKELVIEPGSSLSMQRHNHRAENWYVLKGECTIETEWEGRIEYRHMKAHDRSYTIDPMIWHKGINNSTDPCHILEVQYGDQCVEEDIERR
jgi:cytidyltransferase-like protein